LLIPNQNSSDGLCFEVSRVEGPVIRHHHDVPTHNPALKLFQRFSSSSTIIFVNRNHPCQQESSLSTGMIANSTNVTETQAESTIMTDLQSRSINASDPQSDSTITLEAQSAASITPDSQSDSTITMKSQSDSTTVPPQKIQSPRASSKRNPGYRSCPSVSQKRNPGCADPKL